MVYQWSDKEISSKGTDFNEVSNDEIVKAEHILNTRARASLGYLVHFHAQLKLINLRSA